MRLCSSISRRPRIWTFLNSLKSGFQQRLQWLEGRYESASCSILRGSAELCIENLKLYLLRKQYRRREKVSIKGGKVQIVQAVNALRRSSRFLVPIQGTLTSSNRSSDSIADAPFNPSRSRGGSRFNVTASFKPIEPEAGDQRSEVSDSQRMRDKGSFKG